MIFEKIEIAVEAAGDDAGVEPDERRLAEQQ